MIKEDLDRIRYRLTDRDFLENKGLSNEVGVHVFCYEPKDEMIVQSYIKRLKSEENTSYRIIERDLYELFLQLLEDKRILDKIPDMEEKKGGPYLLEKLQNIAGPKAILQKMDYEGHQPGQDVLFLTGVGKIYPFLRSHKILDSMQSIFEDIPVVLFYPGTFDGNSLSLFGEFLDGNYYRAFNLI